jgi:hypothetical protein
MLKSNPVMESKVLTTKLHKQGTDNILAQEVDVHFGYSRCFWML